MELLNLDELAPPPLKTVVIGGVKYVIEELGVGDFLAAYADSKKLATEEDVEANLEATIAHVCRSIPTIPVEKVRALKFKPLFTLNSFINGTLAAAKEVGEQVAAKETASGN